MFIARIFTPKMSAHSPMTTTTPVAMCYSAIGRLLLRGLWNSLPADVRSASSLTTFRRKLKTHLFQQTYPNIVLWLRRHSGP